MKSAPSYKPLKAESGLEASLQAQHPVLAEPCAHCHEAAKGTAQDLGRLSMFPGIATWGLKRLRGLKGLTAELCRQ